MLWKKVRAGEEMEKEPQYLFLEAEHSIRVWVRGEGRASWQEEQQRSSKQQEQGGPMTWASSWSCWCQSPRKGAGLWDRKLLSGKLSHWGWKELSGPSGLTCCLQKRKPRPRDVMHQPTDWNPGTSHQSKDLAHSTPRHLSLIPCENLSENLQKP